MPEPETVVPELSRRAKWMLVIIGSLIGILFGLVAGFVVKRANAPELPEGSSFENLSDFRKALSERDSRDTKADSSVSLRSIIVGDPSDQIIYRLAPNLNLKFQEVPVRTNSFGIRGPERPLAKPDGVYRIMLLGDSFAFGWGVEEDKIFATRIEEILNESGGVSGKKVELFNFGVPGYSTFQEVAMFQDLGVKLKADAVLVYFVDNDFGLPFFIKNFDGVSNEMMSNRHFVKSERTEDPEVQKKRRELLSLLDANHALNRLADTAKEMGIPVFFTINPGKNAEKMVQRLWVLQKRPDIKHVWVRDLLLAQIESEKIDPATLTLANDPHPSAKKHEMLAQLLVRRLRESGLPR